jgi:hypothetical protein
MHIYHNFRFTESEEKIMSNLMLNFIPFKNSRSRQNRIKIFARSRSRIKISRLRNTGYK